MLFLRYLLEAVGWCVNQLNTLGAAGVHVILVSYEDTSPGLLKGDCQRRWDLIDAGDRYAHEGQSVYDQIVK